MKDKSFFISLCLVPFLYVWSAPLFFFEQDNNTYFLKEHIVFFVCFLSYPLTYFLSFKIIESYITVKPLCFDTISFFLSILACYVLLNTDLFFSVYSCVINILSHREGSRVMAEVLKLWNSIIIASMIVSAVLLGLILIVEIPLKIGVGSVNVVFSKSFLNGRLILCMLWLYLLFSFIDAFIKRTLF
jgi:hypothetical protein